MAKARAQAKKLTKTLATGFFGLPLSSWVGRARLAKGAEARSGKRAFLVTVDTKDPKALRGILSPHLSKSQMDTLFSTDAELVSFQGSLGHVTVLRAVVAPRDVSVMNDVRDATLAKSPYARVRDCSAQIFSQLMAAKADKWIFELDSIALEMRRGLFVGLEVASYSYMENRDNPRRPARVLPQILFRSSSEELSTREIQGCGRLGKAMNIARHLVNLPAGDLNPRTYAEAVQSLFANSDSVTIDVWQGDRLVEERMNLLRAVGLGAEEGARLVHLKYRPKNARAGQAPFAIVGKGITFDTGGLDIKPSSAMRLMKKDMGGSAGAVGLLYWADQSGLDIPLDVYLSLAENAIAGPSFRPGDIITARNGLTIEIHNTDAEGRLVLADALDVAVNQTGEDKPCAVIDLATLTGAIKVGLGGEIAGLFSNNDSLADKLSDAGAYKGDLAWRMPLFQPYKAMLRSTFADYANSSDGFAGAITAALFLELFVGETPWAHLDIYSWKDGAGGAYSEGGGNGQPVQMLVEFFTRISESADGFRVSAVPSSRATAGPARKALAQARRS